MKKLIIILISFLLFAACPKFIFTQDLTGKLDEELKQVLPRALKNIELPKKVLIETKIIYKVRRENPFVVAEYIPEEKTITVNVFSFKEYDFEKNISKPIDIRDLTFTLSHEFGHAVYFQLLNEEEINLWREITPGYHEKEKLSREEPWEKSRIELFAEIYRNKFLKSKSKGDNPVRLNRTLAVFNLSEEIKKEIDKYFKDIVEKKIYYK